MDGFFMGVLVAELARCRSRRNHVDLIHRTAFDWPKGGRGDPCQTVGEKSG